MRDESDPGGARMGPGSSRRGTGGRPCEGDVGEVRGGVGLEGCVGRCQHMFIRTAKSDPSIFCA